MTPPNLSPAQIELPPHFEKAMKQYREAYTGGYNVPLSVTDALLTAAKIQFQLEKEHAAKELAGDVLPNSIWRSNQTGARIEVLYICCLENTMQKAVAFKYLATLGNDAITRIRVIPLKEFTRGQLGKLELIQPGTLEEKTEE